MKLPGSIDATPRGLSAAQSILRVDHSAGRWNAVPMDLLNDDRLGLDTRGFAAWLLARPEGWRILASALPVLLSSKVEHVGREKTRRILRELEAAGYLTRLRHRTPDGRWIWDICFRPTPSPDTLAPVTMDGLAVDGSAADGSATGGKPVDRQQILIRSDSDQCISERTTTTAEPKSRKAVVGDLGNLRFPEFLSGNQLASAKKLMAGCPADDAQGVLDEVGAMVAQRVARHPMGLMRDLISKAIQGRFIPNRSLGTSKSVAPSTSTISSRPTGSSRSEPPPQTQAAVDAAKQTLSSLRSRFESKLK